MDTPLCLGVDFGARRIGLAANLGGAGWALALETIEVEGRDLARAARQVARRARELGAEVVVLGRPLHLRGRAGRSVELAERFARFLEGALDPGARLEWADERMSSALAHRQLDESGARGARRRRAVDPLAAAAILDAWLGARARS